MVFPIIDSEVIRLTSPDGKLDAVMIGKHAGAMSTTRYMAYIIPKSHEVSKNDIAVFQGKRVLDEKFTWIDNQTLLIQYSKADIYHFQNYIYPIKEDPKKEIRIIEQQVTIK